jgi:hypothetical protein
MLFLEWIKRRLGKTQNNELRKEIAFHLFKFPSKFAKITTEGIDILLEILLISNLSCSIKEEFCLCLLK